MNILKPTYVRAGVVDIPLERLLNIHPDLGAITWDLDGTLVDHLGETVPDEHLEVMEEANRLGLGQGIVSNAHTEHRRARVHQIADIAGRKIGIHNLVRVCSLDVDARKPRPVIFHEAARQLEVEPGRILHTGDQIYRDVVGPNLAKLMGSILVAPYGGTADEGWPVRMLQRPLERAVRTTMDIPFKDSDFPRNPPLVSVEWP